MTRTPKFISVTQRRALLAFAVALCAISIAACSHSPPPKQMSRQQFWDAVARQQGELPPAEPPAMNYKIVPGNNPPLPHNIATPDNWVGGFGPPAIR